MKPRHAPPRPPDEVIRQVVFDNQAEFLGQSAKFTLPTGYAVAQPA